LILRKLMFGGLIKMTTICWLNPVDST
jgi:hypothetical protein